MKTILNIFSCLFIFKISLCSPNCTEGFNNCAFCHPLTHLCIKCDSNIYIPNENGGCQFSRKCIIGNNYCFQCNKNGILCDVCENGYYPDENGGCSYTDNCEISYKGECLKCKIDFILVGNKYNLKICKSLYSEDFYNCQNIDEQKGLCDLCKESYYLNSGDKKCTKTENCAESNYGICKKCNPGYYLNKKKNKCIIKNEFFINCMQTVNGKTCDICDEGYFFDLENQCVNTNFCEKGYQNGNCKKCLPRYYLSYYDKSCTTDENCYLGINDIGICEICIDGFYMDFTDGKCKSYIKNEDFKYCRKADGGTCYECIASYFVGDDNKCSGSKNCVEIENGICKKCLDNYHLGLDNICTNTEYCIYTSPFFDNCIECEDNFYFDNLIGKCIVAEDKFKNCRNGNKDSFCLECKKGYYLDQTENLCYSNKLKGKFYKCALSDSKSEYCIKCEEEYFLSYNNNLCINSDGCNIAQDENTCLECNEYHCLDVKTGKCVVNEFIEEENKNIYFRCNRTNEEGTSCEICNGGLVVNQYGLCIDEDHCLEKNNDGICKKCMKKENEFYCLNNIFGCLEIYDENCLECNDILSLDKCTKCIEDYDIDEDGYCLKIKQN